MAKRGRPPMHLVTAEATRCRFEELRAGGMGITQAETKMLDQYPHLTSQQAIRKRRKRAEAEELTILWMGFCAAAMLADLTDTRKDGLVTVFSYKTPPQEPG